MTTRTTSSLRLIRALFLAALLFALTMASLPQPPLLPGQPGDKVQHMLAFTVLAALANLGYPRMAKWKILAALAAFGALIEAVQIVPALRRDASLLDWLADAAAIAVTLGLLTLVQKMSARRVA